MFVLLLGVCVYVLQYVKAGQSPRPLSYVGFDLSAIAHHQIANEAVAACRHLNLILGNHDAVRIPIDLADLNLDVIVLQSLEVILAKPGLVALLFADTIPLKTTKLAMVCSLTRFRVKASFFL